MDQLHNAFRRELQLVGAEDLKYFADLTQRPEYGQLQLSKSGQAKRMASLTVKLLENTLKAWKRVSPQQFTAAWATCGYIQKDEAVDLQAAARTLDPSGMSQAFGANEHASVRLAKVPQWQVLRADGELGCDAIFNCEFCLH